MNVAPGSRLGPYEVVAQIGEGGMGVVFRARDSNLKREVALKVLPAGFTQDPERLARFEREATLLAQLNHPNIAHIYGLETSGDTRALVMELVEGPTLAERLEEGPFPLTESFSVALQIALALEEAHEKGIVHRDLKPQNIKASIEGRVKVLDFGLAKAMDPLAATSGGGVAAASLQQSPTLTAAHGTQLGVILGTAAYMSPEQAKGGTVDKRADIWAFGVVLWEMLSGRRLFAGDSVPETLAEVFKGEIDLDSLPAAVPPSIRRLLRRCLERSPRNRLHDIADARLVIEDVLAGRTDAAPPAPAPSAAAPAPGLAAGRRAAWLGVGAAVGAAAGVALALLWPSLHGGAAEPRAGAVATIRTLVSAGESGFPELAPDGRTLAFFSRRNGDGRIWIKDLVSGSESGLGPLGSRAPSFSPDGTGLAFTIEQGEREELHRIALATREVRLVSRDAGFGTWSPDGRSIVFQRDRVEGEQTFDEVVRVDPGTGQERVLYRRRTGDATRLNGALWSPDGSRIATALIGGQAGLADRVGVLDVASGALAEIPIDLPGLAGVKLFGVDWVTNDRLVLLVRDGWQTITSSGRVAVLDLGARTTRSLVPVQPVRGGIAYAGSGSVIVGLGSEEQSLSERRGAGRWLDSRPLTEGPFFDRQPVYSPEGRWIVFTSNRSGNLDLWRLDLTTGELQRLTDHEAEDWDPGVSADGRSIVYSSNRTGRFQIWLAEADGSSPRQVTEVENAQNPTMTPDGEWIVFVRQDAGPEANGVWKVRPDGRDPTQIARGGLFVPETSPDGRYVACVGVDAHDGGVLARVDGSAAATRRLPRATRYRWTTDGAKVELWTLAFADDGGSIRRYPFDPEDGTLGSPAIVVAADPAVDIETFGVARDGSAVTLSTTTSARTQIVRIDGLEGLEAR